MSACCPYCASARRRPGPERPGLRYAICADCKSGYVESEVIDFRAYYREYDPVAVRSLPAIIRRRYVEMVTMLGRAAPGRRLLEVGCGNGHFLATAQEMGWQVCGTELSRAHAERACGQGLEVAYGDLVEEPLFPGRVFDAVVAMELVEHLPEPAKFFAATAERLVSGGILMLTTPNFGSVTRRLLGTAWSVLDQEHVSLASPRGLAVALDAAGFEVVRLRSKSLYLGEYRRALACGPKTGGVSLATENAELRDRIEESRVLSATKSVANLVLGISGLGEALECVARRRRGGA